MADVELLMQNGTVVEGTDVRREGETYLVELKGGGTIVIPVPLVKEVRLKQGKPPPRQPEDTGHSGLVDSQPQQLAGEPVKPVRTSEQLGVFGEPSKFSQGVVDSDWVPETDWNMDPHKQNNFAPSKWSKGVVDSEWKPTSAYDTDKDVMADSRSSFKSGIDNSWQPTDGFKK